MIISSVPASPLTSITVLEVSGPLGTAHVSLSGLPSTWVDAINNQSGVTGVQALITSEDTVLEDGTHVDPLADGYLLLFTTARGSGAQLAAGLDRPAAGLGFSVTRSRARGRDDQPGAAVAKSAPLTQDIRPNPAT